MEAWKHQPLESEPDAVARRRTAVYDRILVALRGDEMDEAILLEATGLACALGATLVLLQVTHTHSGDVPGSRREELQARLEARAGEVRCQGPSVEVVVREGEPWEEICSLAENGSIDLLVMGKRHHSEAWDLISGSQSERVIKSCPISVLLVDSGSEELRH